MSEPEYLSPSQLRMFEQDPGRYYRIYVTKSQPRDPQNIQMATGSAFDLFVKMWLESRLVLDDGTIKERGPGLSLDHRPAFKVDTRGIDTCLLSDALANGWAALQLYRKSRMLERLVLSLIGVPGRFDMESEYRATVGDGVRLMGRPDLFYGTDLCLDWKVNGWVSGRASPAPGFRYRYPKGDRHAKYSPMIHNGHECSAFCGNEDWADQVGTYLLMRGQTSGVGIVHQIVGRESVAEHVFHISEEYLMRLVERYTVLWRAWVEDAWDPMDDLIGR